MKPYFNRLLELADYLDALPALQERRPKTTPRFDMSCFYYPAPCGARACALGHAGLMPRFRKLGLRTDRRTGDVRYKDYLFFAAAARFFKISFGDASNLFRDRGIRNTPTDVAEDIRCYVCELK